MFEMNRILFYDYIYKYTYLPTFVAFRNTHKIQGHFMYVLLQEVDYIQNINVQGIERFDFHQKVHFLPQRPYYYCTIFPFLQPCRRNVSSSCIYQFLCPLYRLLNTKLFTFIQYMLWQAENRENCILYPKTTWQCKKSLL